MTFWTVDSKTEDENLRTKSMRYVPASFSNRDEEAANSVAYPDCSLKYSSYTGSVE